MDTLRGLLYLETTNGEERLCAAVEDPKTKSLTHILVCKGKSAKEREGFSKKRGTWKFRAYKFRDLERVDNVEKGIERIIPNVPESLYIRIPISELKKLELWWID